MMDGALERFTAIVQAHYGRVLQYTGDGMLAAFGAEEANEDDVESAVRAGLAIIEDATAQADEVKRRHGVADFDVRAGVHTGTVLLGGGVDADGSIRGATVNVAARMEQSAPPGAPAHQPRHLSPRARPVRSQRAGADAGQGRRAAAAHLPRASAPSRARSGSRAAASRACTRRWSAARPSSRWSARRFAAHRHRAAGARAHHRRRGRARQEPAARRVPADARPRRAAGCCWAARTRAARCTRTACCATCCSARSQSAEADSRRGGAPQADRQGLRRSSARRRRGADPPDRPSDRPRLLDAVRMCRICSATRAASRTGRSTPACCACAAWARRRPVVVVLDDLHWADAETLAFMRRLLEANRDTPLLSADHDAADRVRAAGRLGRRRRRSPAGST